MSPVYPGPPPRVDITITAAGEFRFLMPSGAVHYMENTALGLRRAYALHEAGYDVWLDGNPLVPTKGFLGWLHRVVDRLDAYFSKRRKP